eukprot:COSAG03_NODE_28965_length_192_cov_12.935484_1_plen_48_part_01
MEIGGIRNGLQDYTEWQTQERERETAAVTETDKRSTGDGGTKRSSGSG